MSVPEVSVLMAVYNGEKYLQEAVDSILNQTFGDFEFIIVDDGSKDSTPALLAEYAARDSRIVLLHNEKNMNLASSLNRGLQVAQGKYIARMDADDFCVPTRIERQVAFMEANPHIGMCGSAMQIYGRYNVIWRNSLDNRDLQSDLFFSSSFAHPSLIIRRDLLTQHNLQYNVDFSAAEDFELWVRLAKFTILANLPDVLYHYRVHAEQTGVARRATQYNQADIIRLSQLAKLGIVATDEEKRIHTKALRPQQIHSQAELPPLDRWFQKLQAANQQTNAFPEPRFSYRLAKQWFLANRKSANPNLSTWRYFWRSPLSRSHQISIETLKFGVLCALPWVREVRRRTLSRKSF